VPPSNAQASHTKARRIPESADPATRINRVYINSTCFSDFPARQHAREQRAWLANGYRDCPWLPGTAGVLAAIGSNRTSFETHPNGFYQRLI
jgi:hypothetical protein